MGDDLMRPAKVAISFIGTGKYLNFLPKWYEQVKENFLPELEKTFLVFTDGKGDFPEDVHVYEQEHLDWPYITLKRFEILKQATLIKKAELKIHSDKIDKIFKIRNKIYFDGKPQERIINFTEFYKNFDNFLEIFRKNAKF